MRRRRRDRRRFRRVAVILTVVAEVEIKPPQPSALPL